MLWNVIGFLLFTVSIGKLVHIGLAVSTMIIGWMYPYPFWIWLSCLCMHLYQVCKIPATPTPATSLIVLGLDTMIIVLYWFVKRFLLLIVLKATIKVEFSMQFFPFCLGNCFCYSFFILNNIHIAYFIFLRQLL